MMDKKLIEYKTTDGNHLAPYPDMTDDDLHNFELDMNIPDLTFKDRGGEY